jgi:hypothetical protein
LHEHVFGVVGGFVTVLETGEMFAIGSNVVVRQEDSTAGEPGLDGVQE